MIHLILTTQFFCSATVSAPFRYEGWGKQGKFAELITIRIDNLNKTDVENF